MPTTPQEALDQALADCRRALEDAARMREEAAAVEQRALSAQREAQTGQREAEELRARAEQLRTIEEQRRQLAEQVAQVARREAEVDRRARLDAEPDDRADLIRRLFPVAISVGFAARWTQMEWLKNVSCPSYLELEEIPRLATGFLIVLICWDWYHRDVRLRPLKKSIWRYSLDGVIVGFYMLFLFASAHVFLWSCFLAVIFFLFVCWDVLAIRQFRDDYGLLPAGDWKVLSVYRDGATAPTPLNRGPIINFSWLIYFSLLALVSWDVVPEAHDAAQMCNPLPAFKSATMQQILLQSAFTLAGVVAVRWDASHPIRYEALIRLLVVVLVPIGYCFLYREMAH